MYMSQYVCVGKKTHLEVHFLRLLQDLGIKSPQAVRFYFALYTKEHVTWCNIVRTVNG